MLNWVLWTLDGGDSGSKVGRTSSFRAWANSRPAHPSPSATILIWLPLVRACFLQGFLCQYRGRNQVKDPELEGASSDYRTHPFLNTPTRMSLKQNYRQFFDSTLGDGDLDGPANIELSKSGFIDFLKTNNIELSESRFIDLLKTSNLELSKSMFIDFLEY